MQRIHLFLVVGVILALSRGATAATLLVANKSAATVTLYDLPSGSERARIPTGDGPHEVAVSPDGQRAVITNYGDSDEPGASLTIVYIPTASAQRTVELPAASRPHGAQWLDDRHVAVTAEGIDALLLVDVDAGTVLETLPVDQAIAHMVAVTADGRRAYTANIGSGTVTVLDLAAGSKLRDIASGDGAEGIALVNGGRELWVSNRAADTVAVFDGDSLERIATLEAPGFPIRVEADAARRRVFVTLPARDRMAVYDARSRELLQEIAFDTPPDPTRRTLFAERLPDSSVPIGVLLSGDGAQLFVAHSAAHRVSVWDSATLRQTGTIATGIEPDGMDWSPLDVQP